METLFSAVLILVGGYIVIMNWVIFYRGIVYKKFSSWIPIVGGLFLAIGLGNLSYQYWWIPFFIDWGCVPGFAHTAWFYLVRKKD